MVTFLSHYYTRNLVSVYIINNIWSIVADCKGQNSSVGNGATDNLKVPIRIIGTGLNPAVTPADFTFYVRTGHDETLLGWGYDRTG